MDDIEEKYNKAFVFMLITFSKTMKDKGATDEEIKPFMYNAIQGIINTIQDYKGYHKCIHSIINELAGDKQITDERKSGIVCEVLDQIEDSLSDKVNDILGYNNVVDLHEERLRKKYGIEMEDITSLVLDMLRKDMKQTEE